MVPGRVVICGAGIAGISTAFHLTRAGCTDVVLVDPRPPLTLTSDKSTECYRNWWPSRPMVQLMNRSIELLDQYSRESSNAFGLNRRGYLYVTADPANLAAMVVSADASAAHGAGELRLHSHTDVRYSSDEPQPGADLFTDGDALRSQFPFLAANVLGGLHARTAGWLSAQQLGMWMLDQAAAAGARLVSATVVDVLVENDQVQSVDLDDGTSLPTESFVNAAGPMLADVGRMAGVELPVFSELHAKVAFRDHHNAVPRTAPMIIWNDPQTIDWEPDVAEYLHAEGRGDLLGELPPGCHARPEGGEGSPWVLGLWEYGAQTIPPTWPLPLDPLYPEMVIRGLATMAPALGDYVDRLPQATVDGGYYTKTAENRPLAGPAGPDGSYVCGALSGFGIMAACGVGELVAAAIVGHPHPEWARWFDLRRYDDPKYVAHIETMGSSGQL